MRTHNDAHLEPIAARLAMAHACAKRLLAALDRPAQDESVRAWNALVVDKRNKRNEVKS